MEFALTFDTDWAPDFVLEYVMEILERYEAKSTFFFTNPIEFSVPDIVETGIHPDFLGDSSQGKTDQEVMGNLMDWFPTAKSVRTHRMYWDYRLFELFTNYGLKYDSSVLLPFQESLSPATSYGPLKRLPAWVTDNLIVDQGYSFNSIDLPKITSPGIKVILFHPINVYLNSSQKLYGESLARFTPRPPASRESLKVERCSGEGLETFLITLLEYFQANNIKPKTIRELCE